MESHRVTLRFEPSGAILDSERAAWCAIVAASLNEVPGAISATFIQDGRFWRLHNFAWGTAEMGFRTAYDDEAAPLRDRMLAALEREGKAVSSNRTKT